MPAPPWIHRKEAVVIVNPTARKLPNPGSLREVRDWLDERGWAIEWLETAAPGDTTPLAADAARRGVPLLFACGGDGTLNEAVNGLVGSETALAVIPTGTVNLWAREVRLLKKPMEAVRLAVDGARRRIDLGRAGERYFLLMAGFGLDAAVTHGVSHRIKGRFGAAAYALSAVREAMRYRPSAVTLSLDGRERTLYEALDPEPSGPAFASWLVAAVRSGEGADKDVVEVSTLHAAKGLEWPVVHIAGLEDGLVPIAYAKTPAAQAEEQRLLYVGVTRAQEEVRLHWSRTRIQQGEARDRSPSPWLPPIEAAITDLLVAARPVDGRHHLEAPRAELHTRHPDPVDEVDVVLARLVAWRKQAAKVARVPVEAILDDLTLHAIAEARPSSVDDLVGLPGLGPVKAARFGDAILTRPRPGPEPARRHVGGRVCGRGRRIRPPRPGISRTVTRSGFDRSRNRPGSRSLEAIESRFP